MPFDDHRNLAISAVETAPMPATSGTSLFITTGHGTRFPTPPFNATVWPATALADPSNAEIVRVTAVTADLLTIARAQEGSTARSVVVGDLIAATITDKVLTDIEVGVAAGLTALQILARDVTLADVVNSATETTVFSGTVPGGTLGTDGFVELLAQGELLCTASVIVLTIRVKYGGTTFVSGAINMNANAAAFALTIHAYLSASGSSTAERGSGAIMVGAAGSEANPPAVAALTNYSQGASGNNALAVDSSVAQPLIITFAWASAAITASAKLHTAHLLRGS